MTTGSIESARVRTLKTFRREPISRIVWQPRFVGWYYSNGLPNRVPEGYEGHSILSYYERIHRPFDGAVPEPYRSMSLIEVHDAVGASPRYSPEVMGLAMFLPRIDPEKVRSSIQIDGPEVILQYETPFGTLREVLKYGRNIEHCIKGPEDFRAMAYLAENTHTVFDAVACEAADRAFGDRGVVTGYLPRSPLQRLIIQYLGFQETIFALHDYPAQIADLLKAFETQDDEYYEVVASGPTEIVNLGENVDAALDSPRLFEKYFLPYYDKRLAQLHAKGKFCHLHMDGAMKPLLPYIRQTAFDGIEAATPLPQGDVTPEEIKEALGDKVLLDGIPAICFLPEYPIEELEAITRKVLDLFGPRLILGISDELPPPGDIGRVKLVADIVERFEVPAR